MDGKVVLPNDAHAGSQQTFIVIRVCSHGFEELEDALNEALEMGDWAAISISNILK